MSAEQPEALTSLGLFAQYVFDNADFDINTIDGKNTFNCMGGIEVVAPKHLIPPIESLPRLTALLTAPKMAPLSDIPIVLYERADQIDSSMQQITIQTIINPSSVVDPYENSYPDIIWLLGKGLGVPNVLSWHGFMHKHYSNKPYVVSSVHFLPFVNLKASSNDALNSVLEYAAESTRKNGQVTGFVTMD